jgi:hypothetical protein
VKGAAAILTLSRLKYIYSNGRPAEILARGSLKCANKKSAAALTQIHNTHMKISNIALDRG